MRRRILICGATGFIGRNLIEAFAANPEFEVIGTHFERPAFEVPGARMVKADLRDPSAANDLMDGVDTVIQAAATTSGAKDVVNRPYIHVTDNAVMNSVLLRAAYEKGVKRLVFFSCTVMYPSSEAPLRESDFDANREMYPHYFPAAWTKIYVEKMCEFYSRLGRTSFTVLRHSNIYGPHDKYDLDRSHVFGATVTKVMTSANGKVVVWGKGDEKRDLVYVSDLVEAVRLAIAAEPKPFSLYNVGAGSAVPVKELVQRIIKLSGRALQVEHDETKPNFQISICLDCSKIRSELGWTPKIVLDDGIRRTLEWYRRNIPPRLAGA